MRRRRCWPASGFRVPSWRPGGHSRKMTYGFAHLFPEQSVINGIHVAHFWLEFDARFSRSYRSSMPVICDVAPPVDAIEKRDPERLARPFAMNSHTTATLAPPSHVRTTSTVRRAVT